MRPLNSRPALGIHASGHRQAELQHAFPQMTAVKDETLFTLRIGYFETQTGADDFAGIADLSTRFAIERRLIEHDGDGLRMSDFIHGFAEMILRDDADDFCLRLEHFV